MGSIMWGSDIAEVYDVTSAVMFDPGILDPTVDFLADLAGDGPVLEFAIGTGRVALPLSARGIEVQGIEFSPHMVEQLRAKPGADAIPVTVGDMTTTRVDGAFTLVYLVWNAIMNVTTQDEQVAVFENAAAHLAPGGCFVVDVVVPQLQRIPQGDRARVFSFERDHLGVDTYDDFVGQISSSHHWMQVDGRFVHHSAPYRYIYPSELVLMARVAGLRLRERWGWFDRTPFTDDSESQVAVFERPA